jgi:hypothetical protein
MHTIFLVVCKIIKNVQVLVPLESCLQKLDFLFTFNFFAFRIRP